MCFQTYNKIIKKNIRSAKKLYYHQLFEKNEFDMKNTWKIIKEALGKLKNKKKFPDHFKFKGKLITDKYVIANNFNDFFINIGPTLSSKIKPDSKASYKDFLKNKTNHVFNFQTIDRTIVLKTINDLPNKANCGFDNLSLKLIKSIKFDILDSLTLIINQSLMSGVFPDKLKLAKVIPLYKEGDSTITDNYRPNSLLPTLSKVLEKIVYNQLFAYLSDKELFYPSQYGFRRGHSTELAATELMDLIIQKLDAGKLPLAIFLDLSKAFDTLYHDILLDKLRFYGITSKEFCFFKSYLNNRTQYVDYDGTTSDIKQITTGVPQGSILGPLLFIIYNNDVSNASNFLKLFFMQMIVL